MIKARDKTRKNSLKTAIKLKALDNRCRYNTQGQNPGGSSIVQLILSTIGLFEFGNFAGYRKERIFDGGFSLFFEPNGG